MTKWEIFLHNIKVNTHEKRHYCLHCGAAILDYIRTHGGKPRCFCTSTCADEAYVERKRAEKMSVVRKHSALAQFEPAKIL